jgi:hypothetical protein
MLQLGRSKEALLRASALRKRKNKALLMIDVLLKMNLVKRTRGKRRHGDFWKFILLAFSIVMILDMAWMGGIFAVVAFSLYAAAKKTLTVPRIGFVKFAAYRVKATQAIAIGALSFLMLLGVVAFMQTESGGTPPWLLFAIENHMLVIGASIAASFLAAGYTFRTRRMYAYALLTLMIFVTGYFLYYPLHYYLILLGTLILLFGLAMLIRFIRRYPLSTAGSTGGSGSEGQ